MKTVRKYKSDFLNLCEERGYIHQITDSERLDDILKSSSPVSAYIGFDCTAKSLHVGSLIQIMILKWYQECGHKPIVLMGGGTTKVGDPSGKDEARKILSEQDILDNMNGIKQVFQRFINFDSGSNKALMVNNDDWLKDINYISFLRDYGKHFSVNRMLSFDSVKLRLEREQNLSFLEFNYMILQAYDFVELFSKYGCKLQIGGSDQWGNIVNGIELGRRVKEAELFGLTTPLLTTSSGAKMGKTASGAIWLNQDMLSAYDYWQFWRNTEDADVGKFLRLFTTLPISEIEKLEKLGGAEINEAKKILANEATKLCHGEDAAKSAYETALKTFEQGISGDDLPKIEIPEDELQSGIPAYSIFHKAGLASSNGEARKLIRGNGAKVNDNPITDENLLINSSFIANDGYIKLSAGKKRHVLIKSDKSL